MKLWFVFALHCNLVAVGVFQKRAISMHPYNDDVRLKKYFYAKVTTRYGTVLLTLYI